MRFALLASFPVVLLATAAPSPAVAHHGPALEDNNRYLRLTPMRYGVRLAYTVYIGEIPGAQARRRVDSDGNGTISDSEANAYGEELAQAVASKLDIRLDGQRRAVTWADVHVGMGTPATNAGAFSIDLIAWVCAPADAASHSLAMLDGYRIDRPGDTEIRAKGSPGVTITRSTVGQGEEPLELEIAWRGDPSPIAKEAYILDYSVDVEVAGEIASGPCNDQSEAAAEPGSPADGARSTTAAIAIAAALGAALLVGLLYFVRRQKIRTRTDS